VGWNWKAHGAGPIPFAAKLLLPNAYLVALFAALPLLRLIRHYEFAGHYAAPPLKFTRQFSGEIKTFVFKKRGGEYYVSFEKRQAGWVSISSSWLRTGAEF
jgi:hypothetical protein